MIRFLDAVNASAMVAGPLATTIAICLFIMGWMNASYWIALIALILLLVFALSFGILLLMPKPAQQ